MACARLWLKSPGGDPRAEGSSVPFGVLFSTLTLRGEGLAALWAARLCFHSPSVPPGQAAAVAAPRTSLLPARSEGLGCFRGMWELQSCEALRHEAQSILSCPDKYILPVWAPENVLFLQYDVSRS